MAIQNIGGLAVSAHLKKLANQTMMCRRFAKLYSFSPASQVPAVASSREHRSATSLSSRRAKVALVNGSLRVRTHVNVSPQVVSDWFAGRKTPTLDVGLQIQSFLRK